MPLLLYSYLAAEILGPFFASLLIINAILFLGKLSSLLDLIFGFGVGFGDFVRISSYLLPGLLLFSIPMTSTLAVIIAFTRLSAANEILALKSSGVSLYRLLVPVLLVAFFTTGLTALVSVKLIPAASLSLKQTLYRLAREKIDRGIRENDFSDKIRDVVIYVDRIDEKTGKWQGVFISDQRDRRRPMTVVARSGRLDNDPGEMSLRLRLEDGTIHRSLADSGQTIAFAAYDLQLPVTESSPVTKAHKNDLSPSELLESSATYLNKADNDPELREHFIQTSTSMLIEFHKRLALPVGCLILTVLALPLALQSRPGRRQTGLPLGLLFFFLYNILLSLARSTAETSGLPVGPLIWFPNFVFAVLTWVTIRVAARENSVRSLDMIGEAIASSIDFFKRTTERLAR